MTSFVLANLAARPVRSASCVFGIALGVVLVLVTLGLARGMLASSGEREGNLEAELLFLPPSGVLGAGVTTAPLALPVGYAKAIAELPGVGAATPVARYVRSGARGIGFELIEGVSFPEYAELAGLRIARGRAPANDREIVVDRPRAEDVESGLGARMELLGEEFEVVGVFEPEVGARIKMPIAAMQSLLDAPERCSWILVKAAPGHDPEALARSIDARFPGNQIVFTRDIPGMWARGIPSLRVFLNVVTGLAVTVSALTIFLSLYTAVTERTREIGILRSMGGSRALVLWVVESEAIVLSLFGIALGTASALAAQWLIMARTSLVVEVAAGPIGAASLLALLGGVFGALYPAIKAAQQDPVEALSYE